MKNIILLIALIFTFNIKAQDADKTVQITVSGSGKTQDEAKQNALRSAIEQAFGVFISSKTELLNEQVISEQIASVSTGNIKSFSILNELQLPDGSWGVTVKAFVSVDKLSNFVESKGIAIEIKGGLFALNVKQQILNEHAEINSICQMVGLLHEQMQISFDYTIKSSEPKALDTDNKNWGIDLVVQAKANKNSDLCANYLLETLASIGLTSEDVISYQSLNKQVFPIEINYKGVTRTFYLRKQNSLRALLTFVSQFSFYTHCFKIQTGVEEYRLLKDGKLYEFGLAEFEKSYDSRNVMPVKVKINYLTDGQLAADYSWNDNYTLDQISNMTGYKVMPLGVISEYKHGGIVVYKKPRGYYIGVNLRGNEIRSILTEGAAQKAGLRTGDKIISINSFKIINVSELFEILNKNENKDKPCEFEISRDGVLVKLNVLPIYEMDQSLVFSLFDLLPVADWSSAKSACEDLDLNGYNDWRMPNSTELDAIFTNCHKFKIGNFPTDYSYCEYWSEDVVYSMDEAYSYNKRSYFSFNSGKIFNQDGSYVQKVRAVRVQKFNNQLE